MGKPRVLDNKIDISSSNVKNKITLYQIDATVEKLSFIMLF
jgi:hypothetical protein